MRKGIVTYIDAALGKGYIEDENEQDISFNLSEVMNAVQLNSLVRFDITIGHDGLVACNVAPMRSTYIHQTTQQPCPQFHQQ